jgi:hypothetical protein
MAGDLVDDFVDGWIAASIGTSESIPVPKSIAPPPLAGKVSAQTFITFPSLTNTNTPHTIIYSFYLASLISHNVTLVGLRSHCFTLYYHKFTLFFIHLFYNISSTHQLFHKFTIQYNPTINIPHFLHLLCISFCISHSHSPSRAPSSPSSR